MKYLLTAAAGVLAFSLAGQAAAAPIGHVGAAYTWTDAEDDFGDSETNAFQVEGAVAFDLGGLGAAVEGQVGRTDVDGGGQDTATSVTAHLNNGDANARIGGFLGFQDAGIADLWAVGAEGQFAVAPTVNLYGQAGYGWVDGIDDLDIWGVRGEVRWFPQDNLRVDVGLGYNSVDSDLLDGEGWTAGIGAEYQFAGTPWSIRGGYEYTSSDDAANFEANALTIGARYSFGGSLRDRENAGANLGGVGKLLGGGIL